MPKSKIVVSLEAPPKLLQDIIHKALDRDPEITVIELNSDAGWAVADAVLVSNCHSPQALLRRHKARRLIDMDPGGGHATVHFPDGRISSVGDLSPDGLVKLLTSELPPAAAPDQGSRGCSIFRLFSGRKHQPAPAPQRTSRDAISDELARLVGRLVVLRELTDQQVGPANELAMLARQLACPDSAQHGAGLIGLDRMTKLFGLSRDERDLLFLSAVTEVDPRAARLVALLNDHLSRTRPTPGLIRQFGGDTVALVEGLANDGPLTRFQLLSLDGDGPVSTQGVTAPPEVWPILLGLDRKAPYRLVSLHQAGGEPTLSLDDHGAVAAVAEFIRSNPPQPLLVGIVGEAGDDRQIFARSLAALVRDFALIVPGAGLQSRADLAVLARESLLEDAAVILTDTEKIAADLWTDLTKQIDAPVFFLAPRDQIGALALGAKGPVVDVEAPKRDRLDRLRIWRSLADPPLPDGLPDELAERFDFSRAQVRKALLLAQTKATIAGRSAVEPGDINSACETLRDTRFDGTAQRLHCPFEPGDIVLHPETRRELELTIAWARHGAKLFSTDGPGAALHAGGGLACLFSGPPGTGKTMAAQIIAKQINYALFRIDISQVVDKFIGESEKRLSALFEEAERARVALFFDEADALFGKRTEVRDSHDRYANITVDHLLQKLDSFNGLAFLATNLVGNIDDAFLRRIRIRAEFPAPDASDRKRIWERLLPAPESRGPDIEIDRLAETYELVGGEIRNAVYTAHLLAAEDDDILSMRHCVAGLWRELSKTGRISDVAHLGPWRPEMEA